MVGLSFYGNFWNVLEISRNWGKNIKIYLLQIFHHYFCCIATIKLLNLLRSFQISLFITKNAFVNSKRKNYLRTLWNLSYTKQYCTAQKEMFSWNLVLYAMSQFLYKIKRLFKLSYCQKTQCSKIFNNIQV